MNIIDLIFPKRCLECDKPGKYICKNCLNKVPPGGWAGKEVYSLWKYEGVIRKAIIALKYKYSTEIAKELAELCVSRLKSIRYTLFATLVPIPLHWHRKNFRGFNQSEEIGKRVAEEMDWKFIPDLLVRQKSTVPQVQLTGPARRKNLKGVFVLNKIGQALLICSPLVIFDDVFTTGSTLYEAMKVLKGAGCKKVWGLTIAG